MLKYCFIYPELLQMLLGKFSVLHVNKTGMTLKIAVHIVFNSVFKKIMYDPVSWLGPHQTMAELFLQK